MNTISRLTVSARAFAAYRSRRVNLPYLPFRLWIEPTNHCNLKCIMCPNKSIPTDRRGFMEMDLFKRIVDQCAPHLMDVNLYLSGEPLAHPQIAEMVAHLSDKRIASRISTNAGLLKESLARQLIEAGLSEITFSFDALDPQEYEKARVNAHYGKVLDNIRRFLRIKKQARSRRPFTIVQALDFSAPNTLSSNTQINCRNDFEALFSGLGVDYFKYISPHSFGGTFGEYSSIKGTTYSPCTFLWYAMNVLWDGTVVPCCLDVHGCMALGDLCKQTPAQVWNGEDMIALRTKMIHQNIDDMSLCCKCDILWKNNVAGVPTRYLKDFLKELFFRRS